jgi:uncharacterized protein YbcC (UPF0753/DUF2309 family)
MTVADLRTGPLAMAVDAASRAIPPVWPLALLGRREPLPGQAGEPLAQAAARLARVGGTPVTMPRSWHAERIAAGEIAEGDLLAALEAAPAPKPRDVAALRAAALRPGPVPERLPTVAELAVRVSGTDWPAILSERIGAWAAGHFDEGQALWAAPRGRSAYAAWRAVAIRDLTPEIAGLKGFAAHVAAAPETAREAIVQVVDRLGLPQAALETYFHALLHSLGGWAQVGRWKLWQAELAGGTDDTLEGLLAIRLLWEDALFALHGERIGWAWDGVKGAHAEPCPAHGRAGGGCDPSGGGGAGGAAAARRDAGGARGPGRAAERPALQAAFCIDVRSEVFRRALESVGPGVRTLGFAGFFGLGTAHRRFASDMEERRLPVLLNPGIGSRAGGSSKEDGEARVKARAVRAWGRFKLAAVSSFAFVEATGPIYAGKLLRDALGLKGGDKGHDPAPLLDPALDLSARAGAAEAVLRAMSLTEGFARLVLLAGHGANVVNNPHASALHCGACGGYSGEVNARLLAGLLNDREVRGELVGRGIPVPEDTLFLGALHDTTTDEVTVFDADHPSAPHEAEVARARAWLSQAGTLARAERALRLPRAANGVRVAARSRDWAETRPEWALAGCQAFVAAPRARTRGRSLGGRAFLHDYVWQQDEGFGTLELILTAPVVVASWISLQYYGSVVAPEAFGAGNKLLHNVTGGIGVVEGNGGLLRPGLPWQSVHDGERLAHEPLRLAVCMEAPREAMTEILRRHEGVRALFDNRWLHLFALDGQGRMAWRYAGGLEWRAEPGAAAAEGLALAG